MTLVELGLAPEALDHPHTASVSLEAGLAFSGVNRRTPASRSTVPGLSGGFGGEGGERVAARSLCLAGIKAVEGIGVPWTRVGCRHAAGRAMSALGCPREAAERHREALRIARGLRFHRAELHAPAGVRSNLPKPCRAG